MSTDCLHSKKAGMGNDKSACSEWTLPKWLDVLENRHHQEVQLRLINAKQVAEVLNLLVVKPIVITVAGTNGKGSTVAALEAIYVAAGYRVGTYTSPHLIHFNERIRVNHQPISDEALCAAFVTIEAARGDIPLTYFEMATLAALLYFQACQLDVIVLEVGVGGRLDATNIIDADLAIITTIDLDHQDYLGDNKELIGYEKAGILRKHKPCIYADYEPPSSVLNYAQTLKAPIHCLGRDYSYTVENDVLCILGVDNKVTRLPAPRIHFKAAVAAVVASKCLHTMLPIAQQHYVLAMQTMHILGRQQVVQGAVTTVYDVAHNPQAVSLLATFIQQYEPKNKVHAVFSALKDKDHCGLIRAMSSCVTFWYPALLSGKRAASEDDLRAAFQTELGSAPVCYSDPIVAYRKAVQQARSGDVIVVYGSFLTVNAVMAASNEVL